MLLLSVFPSEVSYSKEILCGVCYHRFHSSKFPVATTVDSQVHLQHLPRYFCHGVEICTDEHGAKNIFVNDCDSGKCVL